VGQGDPKRALEVTLLEAQKSEAVIYTIGLLGKDKKARKAREALLKLSTATGGMAFFPEGLQDVEPICTQIAHDIRNQYTLAYYPTNSRRDGSFRNVRVEAIAPRGRGKLSVRTRSGYFAKQESSGTGSGNE
jgi:VWFA-related protein